MVYILVKVPIVFRLTFVVGVPTTFFMLPHRMFICEEKPFVAQAMILAFLSTFFTFVQPLDCHEAILAVSNAYHLTGTP